MGRKGEDLSEGRGGGGFKTTILQKSRNRYVILDFKLLNWKYMNFTKQFDENTYVFAVKKLLSERHGKMTNLKLCLGSFTESNEIDNDMLTLRECGMIGAEEPDPDMDLSRAARASPRTPMTSDATPAAPSAGAAIRSGNTGNSSSTATSGMPLSSSPTAGGAGGISSEAIQGSASYNSYDDFTFPIYSIYYDFKPAGFDDPVLLYFQNK